jgi:hypothetical protein
MHYLMHTIRGESKSACHTCVAATLIQLGENDEHVFCGVLDKIMPVPVVYCAWLGPAAEPPDPAAPQLVADSDRC